MSQLSELFEKVKEKNLTKTTLEEYRDDLTNLYAQMMFELAELEKTEALYFMALKNASPTDKDISDVAIKRLWRATPQGQRLIELNRYHKATEKILSSLKSRIFAQY